MANVRTQRLACDIARLLSVIGSAGMLAAPSHAQNEDIVVTARKVAESVQDVPISITVITGQQFERAGLEEFADLARLTPNFTARPNGAAGGLFADLTIRGQTAGFLTLNADQAVGISIDGAPVTRGTGLFSNLFDIERVEVLKGPQGTLYGKNTTGGVVNVITKAPEFNDVAGHAQFTLGNFARTDAEMVVNVPLVDDKLAVRMGAAISHRDGFGRGTGGRGAPEGRELADDNEMFLRGSLLYHPAEAVTLRVNGYYHDADENGVVSRSLLTVFGGAVALKTPGDNLYLGNDFRPDSPFTRSNEWGVNATGTVEFGNATLTSITSYREQEAATRLQSAPGTEIFLAQDSTLFAQEVRLNGTTMGGRLTWQLGGFYSDESGEDVDNLPGIGLRQTTAANNTGWSLFTQNSFAVTDRFNVTLGLRYTDENREVRDISPGGPRGALAENEASFDAFSWHAGLDFKATDEMLLYASISRGFRSGAVDQDNLETIVDPEYVLNYEAGIKADFFDNRLRFNASGFYSDYQDIQRTSFDPDNFPVTILRNAAQAKLWGFELEASASPVAGLSFGATVGYTKGEYTEFLDGPLGNQTDRSDEPIGGPAWQYSLYGRYEFGISDSTKMGIQANYFWVDGFDLNTLKIYALLGPGEGSLESYGLLNGQIDFDIDFLNGLNIAFFGTNILDKQHFVAGIVVPLAPIPGFIVSNRTVGEPQQWGVRLRKTF